MINWRKVAKKNGVTLEELKIEIFKQAAKLGVADLQGEVMDGSESMRFKVNDDGRTIELYIRYAP